MRKHPFLLVLAMWCSLISYAQNSHIEYGNYLVTYKYIREDDSLFCPSECRITNLTTNNSYYFFPARQINNSILFSDTNLVNVFGPSSLYHKSTNFFQDIINSDSLYINETNKQGPDSNLTVIVSNQICTHSMQGDALFILYEFSGFINVFYDEYIRLTYDHLQKANRIDSILLNLPLFQCLFLNAPVGQMFATANVAQSFSSVNAATLTKLGFTRSGIERIIMRPVAL